MSLPFGQLLTKFSTYFLSLMNNSEFTFPIRAATAGYGSFFDHLPGWINTRLPF